MTLDQDIVKLVKLSTVKIIRNMGFSSPRIKCRTRGLISIKWINNMTEDVSQLFINIIAIPGFWPGTSRRMLRNIRLISNKSILLIRIIVYGNNTRT